RSCPWQPHAIPRPRVACRRPASGPATPWRPAPARAFGSPECADRGLPPRHPLRVSPRFGLPLGTCLDTVLITGGAGFIGSHLGERLLRRGATVRVLDNLDPFYDPRLKRRNLELLAKAGGSRFQFVEGDIRDPAACKQAVQSVTGVVHL